MAECFLVETSARHVHLSKNAIDILFGEGAELVPRRYLSQPGQYVSENKVNIIGPRGVLENVSVLGPEREFVQVEVSLTDARKLGVNPPIRESGKIKESVGCTLVGPKGELKINEGVIIAQRHIHASPKEASALNIKNGDVVWVKIKNDMRETIFGDVVVRVSEKYSLAMHIDTDEANASGYKLNSKGFIFRF